MGRFGDLDQSHIFSVSKFTSTLNAFISSLKGLHCKYGATSHYDTLTDIEGACLFGTGITTETATSTAGPSFTWYENANYIQVPDSVIGIEKVFKFDSSSISNGMFSVKYQLFLNDVAFDLGYQGLLNYAMTKSYLEDIDYLLTTDKQVRFNKRQNRLYMDIDWASAVTGDYIVLDCYRIIDPDDFTNVYNDSFVKLYLTALIKKQWGQNLIKFKGAKLPGGIELNGREIYDDAEREIQDIKNRMLSEYEIPPLDLIG